MHKQAFYKIYNDLIAQLNCSTAKISYPKCVYEFIYTFLSQYTNIFTNILKYY